MSVARFLLIISSYLFFVCPSFSEVVSKIEYVGCQRVEPETVESYLPIQVGDDCDDDTINDALKALNLTGFFEKVDIKRNGTTLVITVKEFPIINKISFEGNSKLSDRDIKKAVKLRVREALSPAKVKEIQQGLLDVYRKMGRYNATVVPKIIKLPDNRVNLVFEINEGFSAGICRIVFIGNDKVSSSDLRDVMYSKVKRWYRFFVTDDIYDQDRLSEDKLAIEKYYHENGYADAKVLSAVAELSPDKKEFVLIITVDEGAVYVFRDISIESHIPKLSNIGLTKDLYCRHGEKFNEKLLEIDSMNITKTVSKSGFTAVNVSPHITKNSKEKLIDVVFGISEGTKVYISKIVINGNTKTRDHVIRREIPLEEGDAYNQTLVKMAEYNLQNLGFFKKVDLQAIPDPSSPDKCVLQVSVEEAPTAEAMISASYSTNDGIGIDLTYHEKNFFGTGRSLNIFLGSSKSKVGKSREITADGTVKKVSRKERFRILNNVQVAVSDPHIFDKDVEGTIAGHRYVTSTWDGFDVKELGGTLEFSYALSSKFTQSWEYEAAKRRFDDVSDSVSPIIKCQALKKDTSKPGGIDTARDSRCGLSSIKHTINFGTSFLTGLKGHLSSGLSTTFAGVGGDARHIKNELFSSYTFNLFRKSSLTFGLSTGLLSKMGNKDPHVIDSFQLGLESFRGFEYSGFGPFSATAREVNGKIVSRRDYIGAKKYWKGTVEYTFPVGFTEELQFRGFVFSDFGTLWDAPNKGSKYLKKGDGTVKDASGQTFDRYSCDFDQNVRGHKILDNKKIRASVGFGVSFITPFGPMKLTYAVPVRREKYDEPFRFLIGFSTTF
jgi:outer membrane protein insertion porin family